MDTFQIRIFKTISESSSKGDNLMISPLSIYHILSLATNGAVGETKKEMLTALGNENQEEMNEKNKLMHSVINNFKTVELANSIFSKITPLDSFIEKAKDYRAQIDKLKDEKQINDWCRDATHGLIPKIVDKISPEDLIVLINAIYFKGIWKTKFSERFTKKREFFNCQKEKKLTEFMYSKDNYTYFENNDIQVISLNYQEDHMEALIILPKIEYDINKYIKKFNQEEYSNIIKGLYDQKIEIFLPKFEIKFNIDIEKFIQELGIQLAFNNSADFSDMLKSQKIFINRIIHSSYIKVDEKGTEAAAVTAVKTRGGRAPHSQEKNIIMDINHPFLFIIRNKDLPQGHDILFISKIENLTGGDRKKADYSKLEYINISFKRPVKWYMYIVKQVLQTRENVGIRARSLGAAKAIRVAEALKFLGYITYINYYTNTIVIDGKIERYLIINVKKTKDFQKIYNTREEERIKFLEKQKNK